MKAEGNFRLCSTNVTGLYTVISDLPRRTIVPFHPAFKHLVPISKSFHSENNSSKNQINSLLLILNKSGAIRKGNIVQYMPEQGSTNTSLPANTFYNMYNFRKMDEDGTFTFLNIADKPMYEFNYKGGKLHSHSVVQEGPAPAGKGYETTDALRTTSCTAWYWVTTYPDGSQNWEYLFTICDGCDPEAITCGGSGGGGGEIYDEEEVMSPRQIEWPVADNSYWRVTSTEEFEGVKRRSTGGHFTSVTNKRTGIFSGNGGFTWTPTQINVNGNGSATASSSVQGWVHWNGIDIQAGGSQGFPFSQVFP